MSNPNPSPETRFNGSRPNPKHKLTVEDQRKGGAKSVEEKKLNHSFAAILEELGALPVKSEKNMAIMRDAGLAPEKMISDYQKLFRLNQKADAGDPKAMELVAKIRKQLTNYNVNENHNYEMKPLVDLRVKKKDGVDNSVSEG